MPESHVWHDKVDVQSKSSSIPIIDLHDPNVVKLVLHASETWGAFELTGHGIPLKLVKDVEEEAVRLFSLPIEQKLQALRPANRATGYGTAPLAKLCPNLMWHEGFTIMGSPLADVYSEVMESYQKTMKEVADQLMLVFLEALNIPRHKWTVSSEEVSTALQLNAYPLCPDPSKTLGLLPHTDTSLFTIVQQINNTDGLQICKDGEWVTVTPANSHALLVNVCDLLHIVSNGRFKSVLHRAEVSQTCYRLSTAYFYVLPVEHEVSPLCVEGSDQYPLFRSLK
ncbi:Non-hem dioxygenase N-terminal domain, partial [Dillenia turbinata]